MIRGGYINSEWLKLWMRAGKPLAWIEAVAPVAKRLDPAICRALAERAERAAAY